MFLIGEALPQAKVLNLYTARHYQTDEAFYAGYTKATGIKINRIEGGEDALFERIKVEGANSPADVFLTVDVARLWRAEQAGIFAPVQSATLTKRIPAHYRDADNKWFGFSARARVLAYDKNKIKSGEFTRYEDLANPKWKGEICTRSSSHPYNLSLISSVILHLGEEKATEWARGVAQNLARPPRGGDTDQLHAVAVGECAIAISNHYYYVRLMRSQKPQDRAVVEKVGLVWPNQADRGTHVNISGGGMLQHAPHRDAARCNHFGNKCNPNTALDCHFNRFRVTQFHGHVEHIGCDAVGLESLQNGLTCSRKFLTHDDGLIEQVIGKGAAISAVVFLLIATMSVFYVRSMPSRLMEADR